LSNPISTWLSARKLISWFFFSGDFEQRFNFLVAANTFKGSSEYIQEKLEAAQAVALKYQREGRLVDFIKKKPKEGEEEGAQPQQQQQQTQQAEAAPGAQAEGEAKASTEGSDSAASSNGGESNTTKP
jgi:hypothetical protein